MRSKKTLYNIFSNLLLQLIAIIYGFIIPKLILKNYGSNINGLISSITQFLGYIALLESGFGPVVKAVLYKPIAKKDNKKIVDILKTAERFFRRIAMIFIIYILILAILFPIIINQEYNFIFSFSLILIISISTFCEYFFGITYQLFLQAEQKNYIISIIQVLTYILNIVVILITIRLNFSIHMVKLFSGIIFIIRPFILSIYVKKKYNLDFSNADNNYKIKQKWDGLAQHIAAVIHNNTDMAVLTIFCNLAEVSVYAIYYLIVKGVKSIIQVFSNGIDAIFGNMIANGEKENLNTKFNMYEVIYHTIITAIFVSTIILITPFIKVYTKGINDVNYIRYTFGYLIVISEFIWAIRLPYSSITLAAGHFKETRKGAWVEAISNIVISIILVNKYGIVGVAIGTIGAMTIRTIEFIYHTNKYILNRSIWISIKKIVIVILETILIICISNYLPYLDNISYLNWIINAIMVFVIACLCTIIINYMFYKKEFKDLFRILKAIIGRNKNETNRIK